MKLIKFISLPVILVIFVLFINSCGKSNMQNDKMVLLPVKDDPTISLLIWFKVGTQNEPKGKEGILALTTSLMTEGSTKINSYEKILEKLYPIAASYNSKVDKEMTVFYGRVHKDNLNDFYQLFNDMILSPAFNEQDFNRIKSQMVNYLENELRYSSDEELAKSALYNFIFENTPYGHISNGTVESLKSITAEDVSGFYKKYFTKDNFVISVGGSYPEDLPKKLTNDLTRLQSSKIEQVSKPQPSKIEGLEVSIIDKECASTAISFGYPIDLVRGDKDFFALYLFNSWFGEHRNQSSHLYQVIREKRGMNYGDYSYIETFLNGGSLSVPNPNNPRRQQIFEVWIRPVQHQHRHFALRAAVRELKFAIDKGITKEQFELTKNYLYNYSLFHAQTTMARLGYQIDTRFYGFDDGGNYIDYFRDKIKNLTLDEVNSAIKKYIQSENMKIAIVTNEAEKFKNELISDAPSPVKYSVPMSDAVLKEDKDIEVFPLKIKAEKVKITKVDAMFQK